MNYPEPSNNFQLENGDLLFQDQVCRFLCEAIKSVTPGYQNADVTHIGIYQKVGSQEFVIEAVPPEVTITPLAEFLGRSTDAVERPSVFVGRLREEYRGLIPAAIEKALDLRGKPYDLLFLSDDDAYYCSELVVDAFKFANDSEEFFQELPMTFIDRETGKVHANWEKYYKRYGMAIPVGELGSSPGEISMSPKIEIIHRYGSVTNWEM
jgi:hypothetical protein